MSLNSEPNKEKPIYLDSSQPVNRRVEDLLERMTLEEKIKQMNQILGEKLEDLAGDRLENFGEKKTPEEKAEFREAILENGKFSSQKAHRYIGKSGLGSIYAVLRSLDPEQAAKTTSEIQKFVVEDARLPIPILLCEECVNEEKSSKTTAGKN